LIPYPEDKSNPTAMTMFVRQTDGALIGAR
jgi:hypothetical protein